METTEIKKRKDELFKIIANANEELEKLRKECNHEKTFIGVWQWGPGHTFNAKICNICGECLENLDI